MSSSSSTSKQSPHQAQQQQPSKDEFQNKMERLLQLVTNRSQGRVNDDLVEDAVSSLLQQSAAGATGNAGSTTKAKSVAASASDMNSNTRGEGSVVANQQTQKRTKNNNVAAVRVHEDAIIEDEDDYDNFDIPQKGKDATNTSSSTTTSNNNQNQNQHPQWTGRKITISEIEAQEKILRQNLAQNQRKLLTKQPKNKKLTKQIQQQLTNEMNETWNKLEDIPLGRIGAKMMVTFGDNIHTNPNALTSALHGTRQCLQNAIKDARALRRKMKEDYNRAKVMVNLHKAKKKERSVLGNDEAEVPLSGNVDPNMLFKAIDGYDKITFEPKCGFDDTQLEKLFPEEMNAYWRWRKMHKSYTDSKEDGAVSKQQQKQGEQEGQGEQGEQREEHQQKNISTNESDDELDTMEKQQQQNSNSNQSNSKTQTKNKKRNDEWGGHLTDRMAQFDARTERMKEEWYMTFSVVRQGSFLSKSYNSTDEREWEKARKVKGNVGKRKSTWENLPASYVQFLHWIGFDHQSAIPPPNAETTEALAFLGYDFMGKIIEKAIFLRCLEQRMAKRKEQDNSKHDDRIILELERGEQLSKEDIDRALNDSTIGAKPLYFAANSVLEKGSAVQLYFGPGFEDRIEMELEQLSLYLFTCSLIYYYNRINSTCFS